MMRHSPPRCCEVIVVAASAGGVEALIEFAGGLPPSLTAAVLVVLHVPETRPTLLPDILSRRGSIPALPAVDGKYLEPGHIYVAVPGHHLVIEPGRMRLVAGPRENGHRPSADVLFRSAALAYGSRVTGVVLSGADDDGAAGLAAIKRMGGLAIAQDPDEALYPRMPRSALDAVEVDYCLRARAIGELVGELAPPVSTLAKHMSAREGNGREPVRPRRRENPAPALDQDYTQRDPAVYTCPECHGTLWAVDEGGVPRFRCRVGHAFSADSLLEGQSANVESALWMALRALEERTQLSTQMAERAEARGLKLAARRFAETAGEAREGADTLRKLLLKGQQAALRANGDRPETQRSS